MFVSTESLVIWIKLPLGIFDTFTCNFSFTFLTGCPSLSSEPRLLWLRSHKLSVWPRFVQCGLSERTTIWAWFLTSLVQICLKDHDQNIKRHYLFEHFCVESRGLLLRCYICRPNKAVVLQAFCAWCSLWRSDWLKLVRWLAACNHQ